jgi:hypothetical protein
VEFLQKRPPCPCTLGVALPKTRAAEPVVTLCGDCGAPPFTSDDDSESDEAAPTLEYLASAEGAPHHPTVIRIATLVSSINLVPRTYTLPLTLKANPHVSAHRTPNKRKLKKNSAATAATKDSEILQT